MKRILINAYSAKIGGGRTYLTNLLENLPEHKDVRIFVYADEDLVVVCDHRVTLLRTKFPTRNPFSRLLWEFFLLPLELYKRDIDILFCPGGIVNTACFPKKCKVVTMFRNMLPFDSHALGNHRGLSLKFKNKLLRRSMLRSMARANLVIFISHYARGIVERLINIRSGVTIPHGISANFSVSGVDINKPKLPFDGSYILYVSRFEPYKRHMELVKAYALLPESIRLKYKLLIVGGAETKEGELVRKYINDNNLHESVVLMGEHPYLELPALYKSASLFIFASVCENCPNILLEAMGAGAPIVCSDHQPMPEFGGDALVYVSPDDPILMSSRMIELLQDPALRQEYSKKSSDQVKKYSWEITAKRTWESILSL